MKKNGKTNKQKDKHNTQDISHRLLIAIAQQNSPTEGTWLGSPPTPVTPPKLSHTQVTHTGVYLCGRGPFQIYIIWKWKAWVIKYLGSFIEVS